MGAPSVSDDTFETEVLKSDIPVLVDFWAQWCSPCRQMSPAIDQLAQELAGQVKVVKINVDDNPLAPSNYGVQGLPTLIVFKDGALKSRHRGALSKNKIAELVREAVSG
jgi:thioredoxin 1